MNTQLQPLRLSSYNAALLAGPRQPEHSVKGWQAYQDKAWNAIKNLGQPDILAVVELANRTATLSDLRKSHDQMRELGYVGTIAGGIRKDDKLRSSIWAKQEIYEGAGKLVLAGLGALPQVKTKYGTATAIHNDSTSNTLRATANRALRRALDEQRDQVASQSTLAEGQFILGDLSTAYVGDSRRTRLYRGLNTVTRHLPQLWPGFQYYDTGRLTQLVSDGVRVCAMPNDNTMSILTGGEGGFVNAAGPGESAPTLFKGPVAIRSDHILGRGANDETLLAFTNYEVSPLLSGDHAAISTQCILGGTVLALAA